VAGGDSLAALGDVECVPSLAAGLVALFELEHRVHVKARDTEAKKRAVAAEKSRASKRIERARAKPAAMDMAGYLSGLSLLPPVSKNVVANLTRMAAYFKLGNSTATFFRSCSPQLDVSDDGLTVTSNATGGSPSHVALSCDGRTPVALWTGTWSYEVQLTKARRINNLCFGLTSGDAPAASQSVALLHEKSANLKAASGAIIAEGGNSIGTVTRPPEEGDTVRFDVDMERRVMSVSVRGVVAKTKWTDLSAPLYPVVLFGDGTATCSVRLVGVRPACCPAYNFAASSLMTVCLAAKRSTETARMSTLDAGVVLREGAGDILRQLRSCMNVYCVPDGSAASPAGRVLEAMSVHLFEATTVLQSLQPLRASESLVTTTAAAAAAGGGAAAAAAAAAGAAAGAGDGAPRPAWVVTDAFKWVDFVSRVDAFSCTMCLAPATGMPSKEPLALYRCETCHGPPGDDDEYAAGESEAHKATGSKADPRLCCSFCASVLHFGHTVTYQHDAAEGSVCGEVLTAQWRAPDVEHIRKALVDNALAAVVLDCLPAATQRGAHDTCSCLLALGAALKWSRADVSTRAFETLKVEAGSTDVSKVADDDASLLSLLSSVGAPWLRVRDWGSLFSVGVRALSWYLTLVEAGGVVGDAAADVVQYLPPSLNAQTPSPSPLSSLRAWHDIVSVGELSMPMKGVASWCPQVQHATCVPLLNEGVQFVLALLSRCVARPQSSAVGTVVDPSAPSFAEASSWLVSADGLWTLSRLMSSSSSLVPQLVRVLAARTLVEVASPVVVRSGLTSGDGVSRWSSVAAVVVYERALACARCLASSTQRKWAFVASGLLRDCVAMMVSGDGSSKTAAASAPEDAQLVSVLGDAAGVVLRTVFSWAVNAPCQPDGAPVDMAALLPPLTVPVLSVLLRMNLDLARVLQQQAPLTLMSLPASCTPCESLGDGGSSFHVLRSEGIVVAVDSVKATYKGAILSTACPYCEFNVVRSCGPITVGLYPASSLGAVAGGFPSGCWTYSSSGDYMDGTRHTRSSSLPTWDRRPCVVGVGVHWSLQRVFFTLDGRVVQYCTANIESSETYTFAVCTADANTAFEFNTGPRFQAAVTVLLSSGGTFSVLPMCRVLL
jgi:hypothetical protein